MKFIECEYYSIYTGYNYVQHDIWLSETLATLLYQCYCYMLLVTIRCDLTTDISN